MEQEEPREPVEQGEPGELCEQGEQGEALEKGEALQANLHLAGPAPLTPNERLEDCLLRQEHLFAATESILAKVFTILRNTATPPGRVVLQAQLSALEDVKQKMVEADDLTSKAVALDNPRASDYRAEGQAKSIKVIDQVQDDKNLAAEHDSSVLRPAGAASLDDSRSGHMMYEKRPYPNFDGNRRNYPSFRREWSETVTNKVATEFELRLIRDSVLAQIQRDIKNLKLITEVW